VPLVATEGNYLLVADGGWEGVRPLLDEAWFVEGDEERRREWLIARHIAFGKAPHYAREWVLRSDERNAELVATTRDRADLVVRVD
jgi:pantothenate kinase